jgi:hypothetical protein
MKRLRIISSVFAIVMLAAVAASGSFASASPQPQLEKAGPPNVVGLNLVVAEEHLRADGWVPRPFNTDTLFGIVVPSHYTVCHEYRPVGRKIRLLAQKYGC